MLTCATIRRSVSARSPRESASPEQIGRASVGSPRKVPIKNQPAEQCDECGFDSELWDTADATRNVRDAAAYVRIAVEDLEAGLVNQRPNSTTWSIAEYVVHLTEVFRINRQRCESALSEPDGSRPDLVASARSPQTQLHKPDEVISHLADDASRCVTFFGSVQSDEWDIATIVNDSRWTIGYMIRHLNHELFHHLLDIARIREELGDSVPPMEGTVEQINASGGGLPKLPIATAEVNLRGLTSDIQATRRHHGAPDQALCLFSAEVIEAFQAEGHPIAFGSAGENVTIRGIDWSMLRSGLEISIGEVRARITAPAVPCSQNKPWFSDGDFSRLSHDTHPGYSRWYASVLAGGTVTPGDTITVSGPQLPRV